MTIRVRNPPVHVQRLATGQLSAGDCFDILPFKLKLTVDHEATYKHVCIFYSNNYYSRRRFIVFHNQSRKIFIFFVWQLMSCKDLFLSGTSCITLALHYIVTEKYSGSLLWTPSTLFSVARNQIKREPNSGIWGFFAYPSNFYFFCVWSSSQRCNGIKGGHVWHIDI